MTARKIFKRAYPQFINRIEKNTIESQQLMSCSLTKIFMNNIKKITLSHKKKNNNEPHTSSEFMRKCVIPFIEKYEKLLHAFPDLFMKNDDDEDLNYYSNLSVKIGARNINRINKNLQKSCIIQNRSEFIRFAIIFYHLEKILYQTKPNNTSGYIKHVKINGKIKPILDLDYKFE